MVMKKKKVAAKPVARKSSSPTEDSGDGASKVERFRASTCKGIFSYPYFAEPDSGREFSDDKYKVDQCIDKKEWKKSTKIERLKEQILACAQAKWGAKVIKSIEDLDHLPFHIAADAENCNERLKDCIIVRAKSVHPPRFVNAAKEKLDTAEVEALKGGDEGCIAVTCNAFLQVDKKTKVKERGVNLWLDVVQFIQEGEALGEGGAAAMNELDEEEVSAQDLEESDEPPARKSKGKGKGRKQEPEEAIDEDSESEYEEDEEIDEDEPEEEDEPPRKGKSRVNGKDEGRGFRY